MIEPESQQALKAQVLERIVEDRHVLDQLRAEIRPLRAAVRRIQPRSTTAVSLVGTDGGDNRVAFDPFLVELVRIVDSSRNELCLEAVTPTTPMSELSTRHFAADGSPQTVMGRMMAYLGVRTLSQLSYYITEQPDGRARSASWVRTYRELMEWAVLFSLIREREYGSDTIVVFDGLLRTKAFRGDLLGRYLTGLREAIERHARQSRRRIYLAGVAKGSRVLDRYRLAMALESVLATDYPAYVEIPRELEENAYVDAEYARGDDRVEPGGEINRFVGGKMFFVKFGARPRDPIWPVDVFLPQVEDAPTILGCMLADAQNGFPVPLYPRCLQKAHEAAALVDFDFAVLQDQIIGGIREVLGADAPLLDAFRVQERNPAAKRYE
jgi:hypothetical protein